MRPARLRRDVQRLKAQRLVQIDQRLIVSAAEKEQVRTLVEALGVSRAVFGQPVEMFQA